MADDPIKRPSEVIRAALKQHGLTLRALGEQLGERPEKLSVAVKCTNGVGPKAIELRKKVAEVLGLDPYEVWDPVFMTPKIRQKGGYSKLKRRMEMSEDEFEALSPKDKVRSILADFDTNVRELAELLDIPYSTLTSAIYGNFNDDARKRVAEYLRVPPEDIWPDLYARYDLKLKVPFKELLSKNPDLKTLHGFGDFTKPFDADPTRSED